MKPHPPVRCQACNRRPRTNEIAITVTWKRSYNGQTDKRGLLCPGCYDARQLFLQQLSEAARQINQTAQTAKA